MSREAISVENSFVYDGGAQAQAPMTREHLEEAYRDAGSTITENEDRDGSPSFPAIECHREASARDVCVRVQTIRGPLRAPRLCPFVLCPSPVPAAYYSCE